ncbi:MAG: hypothetical protein JST81_10455 [Bacteroidetes bacterium]|jgi:hypothetical protein|nr:hypothetical protein [Bacteroidota bacterium]
MHSFTQEELLQYLYNETSTQKTAAISAALEEDWSLREKFDLLKAAQQNLEVIKLSPRKQTIDNILSYAEKAMEELSSHA